MSYFELYSNIRIRRDVENEENEDKVQVSSRQSPSIDNVGTVTPPSSQIKSDKTEGSPRGQKIPKIDKVVAFEGFDDINSSNNDTSWEDLVDKLDTVINSTLDEKTKEANQTWKVILILSTPPYICALGNFPDKSILPILQHVVIP